MIKKDIAIVHTNKYVKNPEKNKRKPFFGKGEKGNISYAFFLKKLKKLGIKTCLLPALSITKTGEIERFWHYEDNWKKKEQTCKPQIIFNKTITTEKKEQKKLNLLRKKDTYFFNDKIDGIFSDKYKSFKFLKKTSIPTAPIKENSKSGILKAKNNLDKTLNNHKSKKDFDKINYVVKKRKGGGGRGVFKVKLPNIKEKVIKKLNKKDYILQPYIDYKTGFVYKNKRQNSDLRLTVLKNKLIHAYYRVAPKKEFQSNITKGAKPIFIKKKEIPNEVLKEYKRLKKKITKELSIKHSFYTLDFIKSSNKNLYLVEANSKPGMIWEERKEDKKNIKKMLLSLAKTLKEVKETVSQKN